jgi:hypothetical protein
MGSELHSARWAPVADVFFPRLTQHLQHIATSLERIATALEESAKRQSEKRPTLPPPKE